MKIDFLYQDMVNFKAFAGEHHFDWDLPGVTFIKGENLVDKDIGANGAAKSTIFDAWCWCLFGRTARGLRNPDVVPWNGGDPSLGGTKVIVSVNINGEEHLVERWTGHKNGLTWDGEEIDQEKLNAKLGVNFALAVNTVLLAQGRDLFFDLTPEKKMELFVDTLQLEKWDDRSDAAGRMYDGAIKHVDMFVSEIADYVAADEQLNTVLVETRRHAEAWANHRRTDVRAVEAKIKIIEANLEKQQALLDAAVLEEDAASVEIIHFKSEEKKLTTELYPLNGAFTQAGFRIDEAKRQIEICKANLKELAKTKTCPTCGQAVKQANLANHKAGLERALKQHEFIVNEGIPKKIKEAIDSLRAKIKNNDAFLDQFEAKRDAAQSTIDRLRPGISDLKAELKVLKRTLADSAVNPHHAQIKGLEAKRKNLVENIEMTKKDLLAATAAAEKYKYWKTGFKDIKLQLIEEVLGELEIVTNGMLPEVGLDGWKVRYDIERETKSGTVKRALHVEISSPESKGFVKWEAWSGGEGQRLKLIGALALADVLLAKAGVETNIEILDEPALYWSAAGVQDLCAFLADRAKQLNRSIFYIEHQAAESAHFSRILTVVKDEGGAYIVE